MSPIINLPRGEDENESKTPSRRVRTIRISVSILVGVAVASSLAASITIGGGLSLEFGQRNYDVGTCAPGTVQIQPTTTGSAGNLSLVHLTVTGINPIACDNRIIRLSPFDIDSPNNLQTALPILDTDGNGSLDQDYLEIYVSDGDFRAAQNAVLSDTSTVGAVLRETTGSSTIRVSTYQFPNGGSTLHVYSGGKGKTLKSTENLVSGWAIAFQVKIVPQVPIPTGRGYGRTDIQIQAIPGT